MNNMFNPYIVRPVLVNVEKDTANNLELLSLADAFKLAGPIGSAGARHTSTMQGAGTAPKNSKNLPLRAGMVGILAIGRKAGCYRQKQKQ